MGRQFAWAGLLIGTAALLLQLVLSVPAAMEAGRSLGASVVFYVSFFTILTNFAVVMVYAAALFDSERRPAPFFARPSVRAGVFVAITAVFIVYVTMLRQVWNPQGPFLVADILLHYIAPALYVVWWTCFGSDGTTRWSDLPWWLVYPSVYLGYIMLRAPLAGEVPYPFLDVATRGVWPVVISALIMLALFVVLSVVTILADRGFSRFRKPQRRSDGTPA